MSSNKSNTVSVDLRQPPTLAELNVMLKGMIDQFEAEKKVVEERIEMAVSQIDIIRDMEANIDVGKRMLACGRAWKGWYSEEFLSNLEGCVSASEAYVQAEKAKEYYILGVNAYDRAIAKRKAAAKEAADLVAKAAAKEQAAIRSELEEQGDKRCEKAAKLLSGTAGIFDRDGHPITVAAWVAAKTGGWKKAQEKTEEWKALDGAGRRHQVVAHRRSLIKDALWVCGLTPTFVLHVDGKKTVQAWAEYETFLGKFEEQIEDFYAFTSKAQISPSKEAWTEFFGRAEIAVVYGENPKGKRDRSTPTVADAIKPEAAAKLAEMAGLPVVIPTPEEDEAEPAPVKEKSARGLANAEKAATPEYQEEQRKAAEKKAAERRAKEALKKERLSSQSKTLAASYATKSKPSNKGRMGANAQYDEYDMDDNKGKGKNKGR